MKKLLIVTIMLMLGILASFGQGSVRPPVESTKVTALNELNARKTITWRGDSLFKNAFAYVEWDANCFRFRRINTGAPWSSWICAEEGESTSIAANAQDVLELIGAAIAFKVQGKHSVLQSDENNNFRFKGNLVLNSKNTVLGSEAGILGYDSLFIGSDTLLVAKFDSTYVNTVLIGHNAQAVGDSTVVLGDETIKQVYTDGAFNGKGFLLEGDTVYLQHLVNLNPADSGKIAMNNGAGVEWIDQKSDSIMINGEWVKLGESLTLTDSIRINGEWVQFGGTVTTPDEQNLSWNGSTGALGISGGTGVDLDGRYLIPPTATDGQIMVKSGTSWAAQTPDLSKWESDDYGYHSKGDIFTNHIGIGANSHQYFLLNVVNDNGFSRAINATSTTGIAICGTNTSTNVEVAAIQGLSPYGIAVSGHSTGDGIGVRGSSNQGYSGYFSGGEGVYVTEGLKVGTDGAKITRTGSMAEKDIWTGTQAEYDLIGTPEANTVYFINNGWWVLAFLLLFSFSGFGQKWDAVKIGSTDVVRIYQGANIIWEKESTPSFPEVTIGTQTWMSVNLDIDDGLGGIYAYDNNEANVATYGRLYTWDAAVRVAEDIDGWHLPSKAEFETLVAYLGGESVAGGKLKEVGTAHWLTPELPESGGTNESGFTALPGGGRGYPIGDYSQLGEYGIWWDSTDSGINSHAAELYYDDVVSYAFNINKQYSFSVRLIKDTP